MRKISHSVGLHGVNRPDDVRTIQELLNKIPQATGGPLEKLKIDGYCGKLTNRAIEKFQARQSGWNTVTTIIHPSDKFMKILSDSDFSDFIDNTPRIIAPPPPPPPEPKIVSTSFLIMLAAKPGQQMELKNFYFLIQDSVHQSMKALYYFGGVITPPPLQTPVSWSVAGQGYTRTAQPMGADDWAGEGIIKEGSGGGRPLRTVMFFAPSILNGRLIQAELHAHIDAEDKGPTYGSVSRNSDFRLIDSSDYARSL